MPDPTDTPTLVDAGQVEAGARALWEDVMPPSFRWEDAMDEGREGYRRYATVVLRAAMEHAGTDRVDLERQLTEQRTLVRRLRAAVEHLGAEFDPESIRWDGQVPAEWEGNGPCQDCHQPSPWWHAPDELWDRVMGPEGTGGVVCPSCFARRAADCGIVTGPWEFAPRVPVAHEPGVPENVGIW